MRRLRFFALLATIAAPVPSPIHAEKARDWQNGKIIESGSQRMSEVTGVSSGPVDGTATVDRRQWDAEQFVVDAGDRLIVLSQSIRRMGGSTISFRVGKGARLAPGDTVTFAIERDAAYVMVDGKERKLHVDRIALKQGSQPALASSPKAASSEQADAELATQLQKEFPEIAADADRVNRGLQPESELFKCAGEIYRAAVAADPTLTASKGALLMAARQARAELKAGACASH